MADNMSTYWSFDWPRPSFRQQHSKQLCNSLSLTTDLLLQHSWESEDGYKGIFVVIRHMTYKNV